MKTINKIQKTVLKTLAVITSLVLLSFIASAQDFWHAVIENETTKELTSAFIDSSYESKSNEVLVAELADYNYAQTHLKAESESKIELKEWMTDNNLFHIQENLETKRGFYKSTLILVKAKDSQLEFKSWMVNPIYWNIRM